LLAIVLLVLHAMVSVFQFLLPKKRRRHRTAAERSKIQNPFALQLVEY